MNFDWTLADNAVLQRDGNDLSRHPFTGSSSANGDILVTVYDQAGQILPGFESRKVGTAVRKRIKAELAGLPVGGPYKLVFQIAGTREKLTVRNILVGDLWLMAGQSNMQGCGRLPGVTPSDPMIRNFYMNNYWDVAKDPLHNLIQAAAPVHGGNPDFVLQKKPLRGSGAGIAFAQVMLRATGVPQGLIACAHGGTRMDQWDPKLKHKGGYSLYGAMYERLRNLGGRVAGMLWYQGCSDANPNNAELYEKRTRALFKAVRRDTGDPDLPIVFVQLAGYTNNEVGSDVIWTKIREAQFRIGKTMKRTACVPAIDLELEDLIHLTNNSLDTLGKRMGEAMKYLLGMAPEQKPIAPGRIRVKRNPISQAADVEIEFKNVIGRLHAPGRPSGFSLLNADLSKHVDCYRVDLEGNKVIVRTPRSEYAMDGANLRVAYGAGLFPYANITDEGGRSLPCFSYQLDTSQKGCTSVVSTAEVSEPVYGPEDTDSLHYPEENISYVPVRMAGFHIEHPRRPELATQQSKVFYFRFKLECPEAMEVNGLFGSDGPFAVFVDGKCEFRTFTTNPVILDEFTVPLKLSKGIHEFVVAMSSNSGLAYGICCRLKRTDSNVLPIWKKWND